MTAKRAPNITKDELNLAEHPFALLSDRNHGAPKTLSYRNTVTDRDGNALERSWTVTGADAYGLPTSSDEGTYLALMQLAREQGFTSRTVTFTAADLLNRLGETNEGRNYRKLKASLLRLKSVTIVAEQTFFDVAGKQHKTVAFGILDGFALSSSKKEKSFADFNRQLWQHVTDGGIKTLDFGLYLSLKGSVARRLFRYLDKHAADGKPAYSIGLRNLAFERLGMPGHYPPSKVKRFLDVAHDELNKVGFLSSTTYRDGLQDEVVTYRFRRDAQNQTKRILLDELVTQGVTPEVARGLVDTCPASMIQAQLKTLKNMAKQPRNPGGWLRTAIHDGYAQTSRSTPRTAPVLEDMANHKGSTRRPASEVILEARTIMGSSKVDELERQITEEVQSSPLYRHREPSKGMTLRIETRLAEVLSAMLETVNVY